MLLKVQIQLVDELRIVKCLHWGEKGKSYNQVFISVMLSMQQNILQQNNKGEAEVPDKSLSVHTEGVRASVQSNWSQSH